MVASCCTSLRDWTNIHQDFFYLISVYELKIRYTEEQSYYHGYSIEGFLSRNLMMMNEWKVSRQSNSQVPTVYNLSYLVVVEIKTIVVRLENETYKDSFGLVELPAISPRRNYIKFFW